MSLQRALVYELRRAIRLESASKELPVYLQLAEATATAKHDGSPQLSLEFGGMDIEAESSCKKSKSR